MNNPTDKQKWAVNLILANSDYAEPEYNFEAYRDFIAEHSEEYERFKAERKSAQNVFIIKPDFSNYLDAIMRNLYFSEAESDYDKSCSWRKRERDYRDFMDFLD